MNEPSRNEYPDEEFGIVEIDVTPFLTEEQQSWPVVRCESADEEFTIEEPLPALDVRVTGGVASAEGRLPALVGVLSDLEVLLGGGGLDVSRQRTDSGDVYATLVPRLVDGARGRLERIAKWAAPFGSEVAVTVV